MEAAFDVEVRVKDLPEFEELLAALRRAEAERDEARRDAEAHKRQTKDVTAKALELTKEVGAKLDRAEAERDAQHEQVLRLTGERDALVFHNAEIEEAMLRAADQRDELTATRDLLTAEHARLQKERDAAIARVARDDAGVTVHACPSPGSALMPCCGRPPF